MILLMVLLQQFKKPHHQLVFTMFCATWGIFFFGLVTGDNSFTIDPTFCTIFGFFFQICWNGNVVGVLSISVNLYRTIVLLKPLESRDLKYFHFFTWTYVMLLSSLPLTTKSYGWAGFYCWIDSSYHGNFWRMMTLYWPMIGYDLAMLSIYILVIISTCRTRSIRWNGKGSFDEASDRSAVAGSYIKYMVLYPLVFFICSTPGLVNRYVGAYRGEAIFWLYIMQAATSGLMGFAYSIIFGSIVWRHWRVALLRIRLLPTSCRERFCPQSVEFIH
ncbi:MAG: hypothetical protein Q8P67_20405 [archaeon]|nr:hypothetical protein [archaeon]